MVNHDRFLCALPECWQHQSDCSICNNHMTIRCTRTSIHNTYMATSFPGEAIRSAIEKATKELGYKELGHKQEQAVKSFLGGSNARSPLVLSAAQGI